MHNKLILSVFLVLLANLFATNINASASTLEYFLWPAKEYRFLEAVSAEKSYCELLLESSKPKRISKKSLLRIQSVINDSQAILDDFRKKHLEGEPGLSLYMTKRLKIAIENLAEIRNEFGDEAGFKLGYISLAENIGCLLTLKGFVPSLSEIEKTASDLKDKIVSLAERKIENLTEEEKSEINWNISMLQKLEGTYEIIHNESIRIDEPLVRELVHLNFF